jgi:hypothetical protein
MSSKVVTLEIEVDVDYVWTPEDMGCPPVPPSAKVTSVKFMGIDLYSKLKMRQLSEIEDQIIDIETDGEWI